MEQAERDQYLNIVRTTPGGLTATLRGVPRKLLTWRPAPGKWSVHEIVCHLRDAERLGYLYRYTRILAEDNPTLPDVDGDKLALERQYVRLSFREALRDWRVARRELLAILKKVKPAQWQRTGTHEVLGPLSLETILQRQALGNDEAHLGQIEAIKERWEILSKLRATPKLLTAMLRGVSDEVLRRKPAADKWSLLEIACHLRDVERFFVERYGKVANHDRPALRVFNQDELAAALKYNQDDLRATLREFQDLRQETLTVLSALAPQSWQRIGLHPKRGEFSIAAAAAHHVEHDATHLNQLRALHERFGLTQ